jgi:hypothetical protein
MSKIVKDATPKVAGGKERGKVKGSAKLRAMTESGPTSGKMYRTRKQSAAMQKDRARRLMQRGRMAAGADEMLARPGSLKIRYRSSQQQNIFGGVDKVKHKKAFEYSNTSALGSPKLREARGNARMNRVSARLTSLNTQRGDLISSMTGKDFNKKSDAMRALRKVEQSIKTVRSANDYYESNPVTLFKKTRSKSKRNAKNRKIGKNKA